MGNANTNPDSLAQIVKLSYFPQIKVVHTSRIFHGHIYIPWVNWLLMIGTVVVTAAYNNVGPLLDKCGRLYMPSIREADSK